MDRTGLDEAAARRRMEEIDRGRREFVEQFFHHDCNDPHLYDLTINVDHFGTAGAAAQISRGPRTIDAMAKEPHVRSFAHCCSNRFGETGIAVPSFWANSETRYSSSIHRRWINSASKRPCV